MTKTIDFTDAQNALGFLMPAFYNVERTVYQTKYQSFDYASLVPVITDWAQKDVVRFQVACCGSTRTLDHCIETKKILPVTPWEEWKTTSSRKKGQEVQMQAPSPCPGSNKKSALQSKQP